jgi:gliding motility-associated-like protein
MKQMNPMKAALACGLIAISAQGYAQLTVTPQTDLEELARAISGPGVQISNPVINCHAEGYGQFTYNGSLLGIQEGVLLTTGRITNAVGPNNVENRTFEQGMPGNALLNTVTGRTTYDACRFEFDIIPGGDSLRFNFVMGSEEYNEWVGSQYNDVFGFFISGPGIAGDPGIGSDHNIALIPNTTQAVTINNVNNGSNQAHYHDNAGGQQIQYDGFTVGLKAEAAVQPCQTYHLKLIVADASDRKFDTGVFIERIESNSVMLSAFTASGFPNMVEGCNSGTIRFTRQTVTADPLTVPYFLMGTATNGVDYPLIGDPDPLVAKTVVIPANQASVDVVIEPIADGVTEGDEYIRIYLGTSVCPGVYIDSIDFFIQDSLHATVSAPATICASGSTQLSASGGQGYAWSPAAGLSDANIASPVASPTTTTDYSVTVSAGSCSEVLNTTVTVSNMALSATITRPLCNGGGNGAVNLTVNGGIAPYTFSWTGPGGFTATSEDLVNVAAGTYTVTVSDATSCNVVQSFNVTAPAALAITTTPSVFPFGQNIACAGASTGSINLAITGGTGPYNVTWSGPNGFASSAQNITGLVAGTYNVTVTDANGCTTTGSRTLTEPEPLVPVVATIEHVDCFGTNTGSATIAPTGGMPPFTYAWSTTPAQTDATASDLAPGTYTVTVTDFYGCANSTPVVIDGPTDGLQVTIGNVTHVACHGEATGSATANVSGGSAPYTYAWNTVPEQTDATASALSAGTVSVTVTDANGCTATASTTISGPTDPLQATITSETPEQCGAQNGGATVSASGGTGPYTYAWNTVPAQQGTTLSNVGAGSYTATVTDAMGCTGTATATIDAASSGVNVSITTVNHVSCFNGSNGSVTAEASSGEEPFTYVWNTTPAQNSATASGLQPGSYTVTVTDANGCTGTATAQVTAPAAPLDVTITGFTNVLCFDHEEGTATAAASGGTAPYTYTWNTDPVQTGSHAIDLDEGTYTVTVTDTNNCTASTNVHISGPTFGIVTLIEMYHDVTCFGGSDGWATLTITGGSGAYTVVWDTEPQQTGLTATGLAPGIYTATVTDDNGCDTPKQVPVTISGPSAPLALDMMISDHNGFEVSCADGADGSVDLTVTGGVAPYYIVWSDDFGNSAGVEDLNDLDPGAYHVSVTDANGCTIDSTIVLNAPLAITVTADVTTASCQGSATGAIDATISGGLPPYTIAWTGPNGFTAGTAAISGLEAGVYTLTVIDANGCTHSRSFDVNEPGLFDVQATVSSYAGGWNVSCAGATDGSIDVTVTGGTGPYTYAWTLPGSGSSNDEDLVNIGAGVYSLTVTDDNGCSVFVSYTLEAPAPITIQLTASLVNGYNISCNGAADGHIAASASGGTPDLDYSWEGPDGFTAFTQNIYSLGPGIHTLTVTDPNGCSQSASATLIEPPHLDVSYTISTSPSGDAVACADVPDGTIDLTITGGVGPISVAWTGPDGFTSTATDLLGLAPGTYTLTVIDANNCADYQNIILTSPPPIAAGGTVLDHNGVGVSCAGANDGSIDGQAIGGTGGYTYSWSGPNGFTSTDEDISGLAPGAYTLTVTDSNGCHASDVVHVIAPQTLTASASETSPVGCTGNSDGAIDLTIQGGVEPYTVTWNGPNDFTSNDVNITGLGAGTYVATIEDANGCTTAATFTLNDPLPLSLDLDPTVYVGGSHVSCFGAADAAIDLTITGGTSPFTVQWTDQLGFNSNDEDISGIPAGLYFVTVTDANGCTTDTQIMLDAPDPMTLSAVLSDINGHAVSCHGASDGGIDLSVDGGSAPHTYAWSNNATTQDLTNIGAGSYTVTVTDANGCTATATYELDAPDAMSSTLEAALQPGGYNVSCSDASDGSVDATIEGGTLPYTIAWSGPNGFTSNDEDISGLAAGNYTLTVTDGNACTHTATIVLTAPPAIDIDLSATTLNGGYHIGCFGEAEGAISASVVGGLGDLDLAWSGPNGFTSNDAIISDLVAGTYILTVTDENGCTATADIALTEPQPLDVQYTLSDHGGFAVSCAGNDGSITLDITGGTPEHTISWTGPNGSGSTEQDISGLAAGNYHLVVTDANGCLFETNVTLSTPAPIEASFTYTANLCPDDAEGAIDLTVAGGAGPFTFSWSGPNGFTSADEDITGLITGTYTVEVADALGCSGTFTASLDGPAPIVSGTYVSFYGLHNLQCHGDSTGVIELAPLGGTAPYTITVNGPNGYASTAQEHTGLVAGTYQVNIVDGNGCAMDTTIVLTEPATLMEATFAVSVYPSGTNVSCYGAADGWIDATIIGGTGPYTFFWRGPDSLEFNTEDIFGLTAGDYAYELVVTDTNQCSFFTEITLTQPDTAIHAITSLTNHGDFNVSCAGAADGAIDLTAAGGNGGFTYAWNGPGGYTSTDEDIAGLSAGTYTVTITDMNGCTHDQTVELSAPEPLVNDLQVATFPSGTTISCNGANDGSITANVSGGAGGHTFSWSGPGGFTSSDASISGLAPGTYCLTVTDANGCTTESCAEISEPVLLAATVTAQTASCGNDNGAADLTVTGGTAPFGYAWSNGATSEDISGLAPGTYSVTVTDANGCTAQAQTEVVGTPIVQAEATLQHNLCNGGEDGTIDLTITSGTAPYSYAWDNGATTEDLNGLSAGTYSVTVTDDNGCSFSDTYTITETTVLVVDTTLSSYVGGYNVSTWQGSDGSIILHVSGGTSPYTYEWSNGATAMAQSGLPAGEYMVTVTDANGCSVQLLIVLTQPDDLVMPTGFTPNGDGANDTFVIRGLDAYPANTLVILNRWGNVVYDRLNYRNDWTGENTQGQQLPNGTYFAILKVNEGERTLQGYVDLRR